MNTMNKMNKQGTKSQLILNPSLSVYFRAVIALPFDKNGFEWGYLGSEPDQYDLICLFQWSIGEDDPGDPPQRSSRFIIEDVRPEGMDEQEEIEELVRHEIFLDKDVLKEIKRLGFDQERVPICFGDQWTSIMSVRPKKEWSIGECIKKGRKAKGLRQVDLAKILGAAQASIHTWESNKMVPSGDTLIKIAKELEIVDELFGSK